MTNTFAGAYLKIDRASEHIQNINELILKKAPFFYILETDTNAGYRSTFAKRDESIMNSLALRIGDAVQNIRSSLDHAYWDVVSPFAVTDRDKRAIQFPFSETEANLDGSINNRLANKVSPEFVAFLRRWLPHGETGGNQLLYMIHKLGIDDRHKLLTPMGDYKNITSDIIRLEIPDFPPGFDNCGFGQNRLRDAQWLARPDIVRFIRNQPGLFAAGVFEQKVKVPVQVVFAISAPGDIRPVVPTLHELIDVAKTVIDEMVAFAPTT